MEGETSWIRENRIKEQKPKIERPPVWKLLLRGRSCRIIALFVVLSVTIPTLVYFFCVDLSSKPNRISHTCSIAENYWVPCGQVNISNEDCGSLGCCFDVEKNVCYHYFPSKYNYFLEEDEPKFLSSMRNKTPYDEDITKELVLTERKLTRNHLQIIFHEPDDIVESYEEETTQPPIYYTDIKGDYLGIEVYRIFGDNAEKIFTTRMGPLISADTYTEWTVNLHTNFLSGLGHLYIKNGSVLNQVIYKNKNDHTSLPEFMAEMNGGYHALIIENEGPLEFTVLSSNLIIIRSLTKAKIVMNLYMEDTPKALRKVIKQDKNYLPPYWVLGPHICRDGVMDADAMLNEFFEFYNNKEQPKYESDCIHENLFTLLYEINSTNLQEAINQLTTADIKFLMSLPPQISKENPQFYEDAVSKQILYKVGDNTFEGKYQKQDVVFPDFSLEKSDQFYSMLMSTYPISDAQGYILRDNFPYEETTIFKNSTLSYLTPEIEEAMSYSLPWNATSENTNIRQHFRNHNNYGFLQENVVLNKNITNSKFLMTESSHVKSLTPLNMQHINISWDNLHKVLKQTLFGSLFGNSLISAPVCGSTSAFKSTQESLCRRWYMMAATLPIFRISSELPRRDPFSLKTKTSKLKALEALNVRESFRPYFYTILTEDEPIARPMFYNYPKDTNTYNLTLQYMLGDSLLVVQPETPGLTTLSFYLPKEEEMWYEFFYGTKFENGFVIINFVESDWNIYMAPSKIIPFKEVTTESLGLRITYGNSKDPSGTMTIEDNGTFTFNATKTHLTIERSEPYECSATKPQQQFYNKLTKLYLYGHNSITNYTELTINIDLCNITYPHEEPIKIGNVIM